MPLLRYVHSNLNVFLQQFMLAQNVIIEILYGKTLNPYLAATIDLG